MTNKLNHPGRGRLLQHSLKFSTIFLITSTVLLLGIGCGDKATDPVPEVFSISGTLSADGPLDFTTVTVNLYDAPEDAQMKSLLSSYPFIGLVDADLMLFNPNSAVPFESVTPSASGEFQFTNLYQGDYIVDAANACEAQGVFNLVVKFCPPHMENYPLMKERIEARGMPHIMFELEHEAVSLEAIRTRTEAFIETIRSKQ
ncbi:2-hydroxyacyl-CoA dehydratase family protein [bacterium]|nr:2-hydroxyacyl-CoA dehydratase family protein [bacterium]